MSIPELLSMSIHSTNYSYWLIAAALPPLMFLSLKNKKKGLIQRIMIKMIEKRMLRKKKSVRFGLKDVFGALSLISLVLFFVFATGGASSGLAIPMAIAFLVFLLAWAIAA